MDIDKLILFGFDTVVPVSFGSLMDIDKLILVHLVQYDQSVLVL